ncbi:MAG: PQQ-binding-like beta-propeller repeat protein [Chloroflexi bacterium]|nr:PQQ-binding-like beta-propeller repeat protein [Chloroflexota bacterium]
MLLLSLGLLAAILASACTAQVATHNGWSAPAIVDGSVYVGSRDGHVFAFKASGITEAAPIDLTKLDQHLDAKSGEWIFPSGKDETIQAIYGTPVVTADKVFVGSLNQRLYAIDRSTGAQAWVYVAKGDVFGGAVLYKDTLIFTDSEGWLYAVSTDKGLDVWAPISLSDTRFWSTPVVATDGTLLVAGMDKTLYALDANNKGVLKWKFSAGGAMAATPLVANGRVYIGDFTRKFYALDLANGTKQQEFKADDWIWNDAIVANGTIYVGSLGGVMYALDADTLQQRWRYPAQGSTEILDSIRAAPVIVNNTLYFAEKGGQLYALNPASGTPAARPTALGQEVLSSLIASGNNIYIHDQDEKFRVVAVK